MPSCAVIVPCYNQSGLLAECLPTLVAQTFADWEAFVVDDGSTIGDARTVVADIGDVRIKYVRHERNRGLAAARNTGIRSSSAKLVFTLDCDDQLDPTCLATLRSVLDERPDVACAYPDFEEFGGSSGLMRFSVGDERSIVRDQWLPGPGIMYRRELWERVGGYCEDPALRFGNEDWDFYLSAAEIGFRAHHVPEALYRYRVSATSMGVRLQYHSHVTRDFMYRRHQALFDRYGAGRRFRAEGYFNAAAASLSAGKRRRAIKLALRAWRLGHSSRAVAGIIARSLAPRRVVAFGRRLRARPVNGGQP